jgi:uncharacterized protein YaaN involved in tellurite resistance
MSTQTALQLFTDKDQLRNELQLARPGAMTLAEAEKDASLQEQAQKITSQILSTDPKQGDAANLKLAVEQMGQDLQREAARRSAMLKEPLTKLMGDSEDGGQVANALIDLKVQVEDLDPSGLDVNPGFFARLLGYIPGIGTPLKRYFSRFENASTAIDAIINSLEAGGELLKRDNMILSDDQKAMRALTLKLERSITLGQLVDSRLQDALDTEIARDSLKYKFIAEELLFPLRQRIQDLQQQLLVNQQGVLTMEIIIRNNRELIRGVQRALNTTVSALQIGVTLALALANQRIVLEKVQAVNKTTEDLIAGTAKRLRTQGAEIQKESSSTALDMEVLRQSFADINAALDDISTFRQNALPKMAENILELDKMAAQAEQHIQQAEQGQQLTQNQFSLEVRD